MKKIFLLMLLFPAMVWAERIFVNYGDHSTYFRLTFETCDATIVPTISYKGHTLVIAGTVKYIPKSQYYRVASKVEKEGVTYLTLKLKPRLHRVKQWRYKHKQVLDFYIKSPQKKKSVKTSIFKYHAEQAVLQLPAEAVYFQPAPKHHRFLIKGRHPFTLPQHPMIAAAHVMYDQGYTLISLKLKTPLHLKTLTPTQVTLAPAVLVPVHKATLIKGQGIDLMDPLLQVALKVSPQKEASQQAFIYHPNGRALPSQQGLAWLLY